MKEIEAIAEEAYIMAYPMMENYKTMEQSVRSGSSKRKLQPFNWLLNNSQLLGPEFTQIVAPNHDTVYSSTWLDLKNSPQVLSIPDIPDERYYVFQLVNMYNYNFGYIGARTHGYTAGNYLIHGPDWVGKVPDCIDQTFRSESRFAYLIGRTLIDGPEDREKIKIIQKGYKLEHLSQFENQIESLAQTQTPDFKPYDVQKSLSAEFIDYFNIILGQSAIHPDDQSKINKFSRIGVVPGKTFVINELSEQKRQAIERGIRSAIKKIKSKVKEIGLRLNGWNILMDSHGPREIMASRPLVNAAGAMAALYGNDKEEASNFACFVDQDGQELDASKYDYRIRFEKGAFPPVKAFWSITMYRLPEFLLVKNPIDRYTIGDRTLNLIYEEDGSLEIVIRNETPKPEFGKNWLPAPNGPFVLALRNYWPDMNRFSKFTPPAIQRTK